MPAVLTVVAEPDVKKSAAIGENTRGNWFRANGGSLVNAADVAQVYAVVTVDNINGARGNGFVAGVGGLVVGPGGDASFRRDCAVGVAVGDRELKISFAGDRPAVDQHFSGMKNHFWRFRPDIKTGGNGDYQ